MAEVRRKAVILTAPGYEEPEIIGPWIALAMAHFGIQFATPDALEAKGLHGGSDAYPVSNLIKPNKLLDVKTLNADDYDLVIIPGGYTAPSKLRVIPEALKFVKDVHDNGKIVAFFCHGLWLAISAELVNKRNATCYPDMKDDLINAGANYLDRPFVVDGNLITGRRPADLPVFMETVIREFNKRNKK